jgi:photosystem II stability/assembly factor-like uncharacterized protein
MHMTLRATGNITTALLFLIALLFSIDGGPGKPVRRQCPVEDIPPSLKSGEAYRALQWYNDQRAYPAGRIPEGWREQALRQMAKKENGEAAGISSTLSWIAVGPDNIGGRVRSIAIHPVNPDIMFCGSVSGGIFKTTNGGGYWFPVTDFAQNLVIGCIVIDPVDPQIIYAGTGEGYFNFDALRGIGILKSTDGGSSWNVLNNFPGAPSPYSYYFINKLAISPDNHSTIYAATIGGVWKSTNSGSSWNLLNTATRSGFCMDLVMHPSNSSILYASFGLFSPDGIYKTTNGGTSWSRISTNFPASGFGRISIALSRSDPSVLYACLADSLYYTHSIRKTTDGGASWSVVATPVDTEPTARGSHLGGQGWFNNVIAVHPTTATTVFTGGINNFRTTDGGTSWGRISNGYGTPYVHVDQHAIAFHPTDPNIVFFGNDGGVFKSTDGGTSFTSLNNSLPITQFYSGAVHPTLDIYYGGTQDNGTLRSATPPLWNQILGGDGGFMAVDRTDANTVYATYVYLTIFKSTNSGTSWASSMAGIPQQSGSIFTSDRCDFIAPMVMDPTSSQMLVAGTYRVYRTSNGGAFWQAISGDLTGSGDGAGQIGQPGSTISALAIAKSSFQTIYAGTSGYGTSDSARIMITTNLGASWSNVTRSNLPNRQVKAIAIHPANASHVYVVYSGFNASTPTRPGHVFMTTNRGVSWSNVSGDLPDLPTNTVVIDSSTPGHLAIGTDLGVFETFNNGVVWNQVNSGMANVAVSELILRSNGHLVAATHGRGMFRSLAPFRGATATSLSIIIHQNAALSRYLDLYVTAADSFVTDPALTLAIGGGSPRSVPVARNSYRVFKGSYEFTAGGIVTLSAVATDSSGEPITAVRSFAAGLIKRGEGGSAGTADNSAQLSVPAAAASADALVTIIPAGQRPSGRFYSKVFSFGPPMTFDSPVTISLGFDPTVVPGEEIRSLVLLRKEDSTWIPVPGSVDADRHIVTADVLTLGTYALGVGSGNSDPQQPSTYLLMQNYPNPFNPTTVIRYTLPVDGTVTMKVYDMLGREVATLVDGPVAAGEHSAGWDGRDGAGSQVSSGVYFCRMTAGNDRAVTYSAIRKMILVR